jgi:hypothetical protein
MNPAILEPRCHEPPPGWPPEVFAAVTDALADAIIASWRRSQREAAPAVTEAGPEPG